MNGLAPLEWKEFFREHGDDLIRIRFYEVEDRVTVEQLYQLFKARMDEERKSEIEKLNNRINILAKRSLLHQHGKDLEREPIPLAWRDEP